MDLRLSDLVTECPTCGGAGMAGAPALTNVGGFGQTVFYSAELCGKCRGKGKVLTEGGEAILTVLSNFADDYRGRLPFFPVKR